MKPADHPEFFRIAPPPGTSRESNIRLDAQGRFWHDGVLVENQALVHALHGWISRHPDDGRYILTNGYDWTYFTVEDVPYFVTAVQVHEEGIDLTLSDDTHERLSAQGLRVAGDGALYARVKEGQFEAKFTRHAQTALAPALEESESGGLVLRLGEQRVEVGESTP